MGVDTTVMDTDMDTATVTVDPLLLIPRDRQATTVDTTVMDTDMDTATATDAPLPLILRDRLATTVDTTVMDTDMDTATATAAPLLLILRVRLATTADTTPDMVVSAMDITTTKPGHFLAVKPSINLFFHPILEINLIFKSKLPEIHS